MIKNIRLVLEYDGGRYDGYQRLGKDESTNTIENKLSEIVNKLAGCETELNCGSRTEKGVHAYGQVVNFKLDTDMKMYEIKNYFNRYLPRDIAVINAEEMPERFHAALNARTRTYIYRIDCRDVADVFERKYMFHSFVKLNVEEMNKAAAYLLGSHDFKRFSTVKKSKSTVKNVKELSVYGDGKEVTITMTANDFLHNMARIIAGTLMEVGSGKRKAEELQRIFDENSDVIPGIPAEPQGLFLDSIEY